MQVLVLLSDGILLYLDRDVAAVVRRVTFAPPAPAIRSSLPLLSSAEEKNLHVEIDAAFGSAAKHHEPEPVPEIGPELEIGHKGKVGLLARGKQRLKTAFAGVRFGGWRHRWGRSA